MSSHNKNHAILIFLDLGTSDLKGWVLRLIVSTSQFKTIFKTNTLVKQGQKLQYKNTKTRSKITSPGLICEWYIHRDTCSSMFTAALFFIARNWKQTRN
jgi:hypothetical protein